jgi:hypothetical protein
MNSKDLSCYGSCWIGRGGSGDYLSGRDGMYLSNCDLSDFAT